VIRVAFTLIGGSNWTGGHNYLLNLLRVLGERFSDRVEPVLFVPDEFSENDLAPFIELSGVELVRSQLLSTKRRKLSLLQALLWGRDVSLKKLFNTHRINLVFEATQFFGWRFGLPAIAWISDFQHLLLPNMFSSFARLRREIGFRAQIFGRRVIMLSSEDARQICERHYPRSIGSTGTVHFAVPPGPPVSGAKARKIADEYGLPEVFIFMPNQFWKHKNHMLVVEALAILRRQGSPVVVAVSGKQKDPRNPGYFTSVLNAVKQLGVVEDFRILGLIPYPHLAALQRASTALLNPSLFEGWSTTVEEARALGTPMVLSDLDVHREQMGGKATYFDRFSPQSLADVLTSLTPIEPERRELMAIQARNESKQLVKQFGEDFVQLAEYCINR
jgi:glycosyltransferase involved in cell wall biosynthesis